MWFIVALSRELKPPIKPFVHKYNKTHSPYPKGLTLNSAECVDRQFSNE